MMGSTHVVSGPVLALAITVPLNVILVANGLPPVTGAEVIPQVASAAGGAMLPDLDHPSGTAARALGPVTKTLAQIVNKITGGHRGATHSLLGIAGFTWISWKLGQIGGWPYGAWIGFMAAIALSALKWTPIKNPVLNTSLCIGLGVAVTMYARFIPFNPWPITVGTAIGVAAHILGDMLTVEGCPLFWPLPMRFKFASLTTGQIGEKMVCAGLWGAWAGLVVYQTGLANLAARLIPRLAPWPAWGIAVAVAAVVAVPAMVIIKRRG